MNNYNRIEILKLGIKSGCIGGHWYIELDKEQDGYETICELESIFNTLGYSKGEIDFKYSYVTNRRAQMFYRHCIYVHNRDFRDKKQTIKLGEDLIRVLDPKEMHFIPDIFTMFELDDLAELDINYKLHSYYRKSKSWVDN